MDKKFVKYVSVVLELSIDKPLEYGVFADLAEKISRGKQVEVSVRGYQRKGYIVSVHDQPKFPKVLPVTRVISKERLFGDELFELALWISRYYYAPLGKVLKIMLPSSIRKETEPKQQLFVMRGKTREQLKECCQNIRKKFSRQADVLDVMLKVKKGILLSELLEITQGSRSSVDCLVKKGFLLVDRIQIDRSPLINEDYFRTGPKTLNQEQGQALAKIIKSLEKSCFDTHLLYGVTGSGKTEVYLQAIEKTLQMGKGTIMLVPEISLTAQTIERFRSRFDQRIAILHHRLSQGECFDEWNRIRDGRAKIVIGARSAVFAPVQNLGLVIVDEEHGESYKQQEEAPCYHARDVAVMRGKITSSTVILGSATPSLESYYNAKSGRYFLSSIHHRAKGSSIPEVTIVDMKKEFEKAKGFTSFSDILLKKIKERHAKGEQVILFLNRRGYHTMLICQKCRETVSCQHCDVTLTFHLGSNTLACHLCGFTLSPPPLECPSCHCPNPMKYRGIGTELLQKSLHAILPEIRSIRLDADTTRHKGSHQKLLRDFGKGKADVLIGTQMVAKGLHFPEVTLVGVINCDTNLNIPDFRASEKTFQITTQVSGRAGRGCVPGEVVLQTVNPENPTIQLAAKQDFPAFYEEEIAARKMFNYPPFSRMAKIVFFGKNQQETHQLANDFRQRLIKNLTKGFSVHPVIPGGHARVKDRYRFQFLVRGPSVYPINRAIQSVRRTMKISSNVKQLIDIDPLSTFF